ncbi:transposase [Paenibacillus larvae]|nr:transposase [Paenibacillus larvae]MDT2238245.1 transposase [Paenibacillus larvae]
MGVLESGFDDATAVLMLPERYRKRLRTTNSVERLNEEVRRRERVIRIFPNRESVIRLIGALLMEQDEKWAAGKKYLDMTSMEWREGSAKVRCQRLHYVAQSSRREFTHKFGLGSKPHIDAHFYYKVKQASHRGKTTLWLILSSLIDLLP